MFVKGIPWQLAQSNHAAIIMKPSQTAPPPKKKRAEKVSMPGRIGQELFRFGSQEMSRAQMQLSISSHGTENWASLLKCTPQSSPDKWQAATETEKATVDSGFYGNNQYI